MTKRNNGRINFPEEFEGIRIEPPVGLPATLRRILGRDSFDCRNIPSIGLMREHLVTVARPYFTSLPTFPVGPAAPRAELAIRCVLNRVAASMDIPSDFVTTLTVATRDERSKAPVC
jgi:hypothetical protein